MLRIMDLRFMTLIAMMVILEKVITDQKFSGYLSIYEKETLIVKRIFEMRADGKGYKYIAGLLNKEGYRSKNGKLFSICTVKTILENETYIGKIKWGKRRDWGTKRRKGVTDDCVLAEG